jgi:prepilin-type N-terminal cleavage/methylation domain-containing protein
MRQPKRGAFTIVEMTVTVAIVAILVVIVAQCVLLSIQERARIVAHQAALELAANVLEDARAQPFDKLDKTWAAAQAIPSESEGLLMDGKLVVTIEPEKSAPKAKRVTVEVHWLYDANLPRRSVQLMTVFSGRERKKGGTP